ncbi:MAG: 3'-5' exonuclease, partial [Bacteroidales bacterium]|nr:3'-5' exonuclease [Bacteroidales bacterium]
MKLKLNRPLVVFDLESTGLVIGQAHIVEICMIKVNIDGSEEEMTIRLNPGVHIPEETTKVHGISDEDVKDCPT